MNNAQVLRDALTGAIAATSKDMEILDAVHIRVADRVLHATEDGSLHTWRLDVHGDATTA